MSRTQQEVNASLTRALNSVRRYANQSELLVRQLTLDSSEQYNQITDPAVQEQYVNLVLTHQELQQAAAVFKNPATDTNARLQSSKDIQRLLSKAKQERRGLPLNGKVMGSLMDLDLLAERTNLNQAAQTVRKETRATTQLNNQTQTPKRGVENTGKASQGTAAKPTDNKSADAAQPQVETWGVKFSFDNSPAVVNRDDWYRKDEAFYLALLPAMSSVFSMSGSQGAPNAMPGLNFKIIPNLAKHKIPGFQPAFQHLGMDSCICTMVGCFTGADGYSLLEDGQSNNAMTRQALGASTLFDSYGVPGLGTQEGLKKVAQQLDAYKNFQQFYQFAVLQGKELTVEINLAKNGALPVTTGDDQPLRAGSGNPKFKAIVKSMEVYHARSDRTWYTLQLEITDFGLASKTPINLTNQLASRVKEAQQRVQQTAPASPTTSANQRLVELMQTPNSRHRVYNLGDDEVLYQVLVDGVNHYFLAKDEKIEDITGDQESINRALDRRNIGDKISADDLGGSIMGALGCAGGLVAGALITGATAGIGAGSLLGAGALCGAVGLGTSFTPWGREEDISDFTVKDGVIEFGVSGALQGAGGVVAGTVAPLAGSVLKGASGAVSGTTGRLGGLLSKLPGSQAVGNVAQNAARGVGNLAQTEAGQAVVQTTSKAAQAAQNLTTRLTNNRVTQAVGQLSNRVGQTYERLNVPIAQGRSPEYLNRLFRKPAGPSPDPILNPSRLLPAAREADLPTRVLNGNVGSQGVIQQPAAGNVLKESFEQLPAGTQITSIGRRAGSTRQVTVELPSGETKVVEVTNSQLQEMMNRTNKLITEMPYPRASISTTRDEVLRKERELRFKRNVEVLNTFLKENDN